MLIQEVVYENNDSGQYDDSNCIFFYNAALESSTLLTDYTYSEIISSIGSGDKKYQSWFTVSNIMFMAFC